MNNKKSWLVIGISIFLLTLASNPIIACGSGKTKHCQCTKKCHCAPGKKCHCASKDKHVSANS